jgi:Zn-dependent peptidase ImmA (M78 family)
VLKEDIKVNESGHINDLLEKLVKIYQVSEEVILLRLWLANLIPELMYNKKKQEIENKNQDISDTDKVKVKGKKLIIPPAQKSLSQRGLLFTSTVVNAYKKGDISVSQASDYLGLNHKHLRTIEMLVSRKKT